MKIIYRDIDYIQDWLNPYNWLVAWWDTDTKRFYIKDRRIK